MECPKCKAQISENTKYCPYCGEKINQSSDTELIYVDARPVESTEISNFKGIAAKFKRKPDKKSTVYILLFAFLFIVLMYSVISFATKSFFAGFISALQAVLIIIYLLAKKNKINIRSLYFQRALPIISILLIIPFFIAFLTSSSKYDWSEVILNSVLPEPQSDSGEISLNSSDFLDMTVYKLSSTEYDSYIESCKNKGFIVEAEKNDDSFSAYNKDGYGLKLYYDNGDEKMDINLDAPISLDTLMWSENGLAAVIPKPDSNVGVIETDDDSLLFAYVGEMPLTDYNNYVTKCENNGFNLERNKSDKSFSAKNSVGYKLDLAYEGNSIISISVSEPKYDIDINVENTYSFSSYDVKVFADDSELGTVKNDSSDIFTAELNSGKHTVKFVSAEDDDVSATVKITVSKDETFEFKLECTSSDIDVEIISGSVDYTVKKLTLEYLYDSDITFDDVGSTEEASLEIESNCDDKDKVIKTLHFVSDNPDVAEIEYNPESLSYKNVIITAKGVGETYVYVQSSDKSVESEKIKVTVNEKTTEQETETTEEETTKKGRTVYVTPYGKKYHYSKSCAGENASEIDEETAKSSYEPCKKCVG